MIMERQIGEKFTDNGVELEVVETESDSCKGCYCSILKRCVSNFSNVGYCASKWRKDGKDVIFKEAEKKQ